MDYIESAEEFCEKHNVDIKVIGKPIFKKHFADDTDSRWVFNVKISRNGESFKIKFGQSIVNGFKEPSKYDILSCLQKYEPGTYEEFLSEYGYEIYDKKDAKIALKIYNACCDEFENVNRLFYDIIDELLEIN